MNVERIETVGAGVSPGRFVVEGRAGGLLAGLLMADPPAQPDLAQRLCWS